MTGYIVYAEWDATGWWVATVPAVPGAITQCKRLDQVRTDIAEAIEIQTGVTPDPTSITIEWRVPGEAGNAAERARQPREKAEQITEEAGRSTRHAVCQLHRVGFSLRDIGTLTGISYQRAQQLSQQR